MALKRPAQDGFYASHDDTHFVRVTTVLSSWVPPALQAWMRRTPAEDQTAALKLGADFGTAEHSAWERGERPEYTIALTQAGLSTIEREFTVFSHEYGFAGTIDLAARDAQNRVWLVDLKTGSMGATPKVWWQLGAYALGWKECRGDTVHGLLVIHAPRKQPGVVTVVTNTDVRQAEISFLAALQLYAQDEVATLARKGWRWLYKPVLRDAPAATAETTKQPLIGVTTDEETK